MNKSQRINLLTDIVARGIVFPIACLALAVGYTIAFVTGDIFDRRK